MKMINKLSSIVLFSASLLFFLFFLALIIAVISGSLKDGSSYFIFSLVAIALFFTAKVAFKSSLKKWKESKLTKRAGIRVTLMGGRGVGKTSLLTAMYQQFDKIPYLNLSFNADIQTSAILSNTLIELQSQINKPETGTLRPTVEKREYKFNVGLHGEPFIFDLIFNDFPGEYFNDIIQNHSEIVNFIRSSDIILIAVDVPAMLEDNGRWPETINRCSLINEMFKDAISNSHRKLVIFVPIKCEKYMQSSQSQRIIEIINKEYRGLINQLNYAKDNVAISIIPVQTLGGIVFDHVQVENGTPRFFYKASSCVHGYSPEDTELPLLQILAFSIMQMLDQVDLESKKAGMAFRRDQFTISKTLKRDSDKITVLQGIDLFMNE